MMASSHLPWVQSVTLRQVVDARGALTFGEVEQELPFAVRRLFMLHDIAASAPRGHHAHRELQQFLLMMTGSCRVVVDNGESREILTLEGPANGLYAPPMIWLELIDFSPGAVCLVLASKPYDENDYVRD